MMNIPPFLKEQEGFSGIQYDLKRIMEHGKSPATDQTHSLPNLEMVYCESCFLLDQKILSRYPLPTGVVESSDHLELSSWKGKR